MPPCRGEEEDGDSGRMESGEGQLSEAAKGQRGEQSGSWPGGGAVRGQAGSLPASGSGAEGSLWAEEPRGERDRCFPS